MTNYGFRLFQATIHRNGRGDPCKVEIGDKDEKQAFRDYLFELVSARKGTVVHGSPRTAELDAGDEATDTVDGDLDEGGSVAKKRTRPVLVISDVSHRGDHVVIEYLYGRHLGYTHAGYAEGIIGDVEPEPASAEPVPIGHLKSVRPYRAVFMFPEVGEAAVVAVEDASRTCAHEKLEQWLKAWAREDAQAEAAAKQVETGKKSIRPLWWSLRLVPLSDPDRLSRLMKNGTSSKIILTKQGGSDGRTPGKSKLKVEMGLDDPSVIAKARRLITKWFPDAKSVGSVADAQVEATHDLAAVLADRYEGFDAEDYDDAWIDIKDATGKSKQVSPSRWADIFIYPVSVGIDCPLPSLFYRRVQEAVMPLEKSLELAIDWSGWGGDGG